MQVWFMLVLLLSVAFLRKNDSFAYNLVLLESVCAVSFAGFAGENTAYRKVAFVRHYGFYMYEVCLVIFCTWCSRSIYG